LDVFQAQAEAATKTPGVPKALRHLLCHVLCDERHTITSLLRTAGRQSCDWTADYRLYTSQMEPDGLFAPIVRAVASMTEPGRPLVVAVDDSTFQKRGKHIPGAGWHRDPLGPPFHTNLIHGLKFVQLSAAVAGQDGKDLIRMLPVAFGLLPKLPKPPEQLSDEERAAYEKAKEDNSPSAHALRLLEKLQQRLQPSQQQQETPRSIWLVGDGHYTTSTLMQALPPGVVYIGRTRGDTHLCAVPEPSGRRGAGRPLSYGPKLPTPEELRKDFNVSWQSATVRRNGADIPVRYKQIPRAKWVPAGEKRILQAIVVAPLRYRKRKNGPWLYTKPAFLICSDPSLTPQQIIQAYMWRWDIEVHFKEEKQLFGIAHAQVRNPKSVAAAPALAIAAYAGLHLAALRAFGLSTLPPAVQLPKWRRKNPPRRLATSDLLRQLRYEASANLINFSGFSCNPPSRQPPRKHPSNQPGPQLPAKKPRQHGLGALTPRAPKFQPCQT
jgi:DDE superfamily endonuclease